MEQAVTQQDPAVARELQQLMEATLRLEAELFQVLQRTRN